MTRLNVISFALLFFLSSVCSRFAYSQDTEPKLSTIIHNGVQYNYYESAYLGDLEWISTEIDSMEVEYTPCESLTFTNRSKQRMFTLYFLGCDVPFFAIYDYPDEHGEMRQTVFNFSPDTGIFTSNEDGLTTTHMIPWEKYIELGEKLGFYSKALLGCIDEKGKPTKQENVAVSATFFQEEKRALGGKSSGYPSIPFFINFIA